MQKRYLIDRLSEGDEICALLYVNAEICELRHRRSPWGAKTLMGVKN